MRGKQSAYFKVYKLYSKAVLNTCYRILNRTDMAEDATQEVFVQAFKQLERYERKSTFGAWIKRIAINHCLDVLRKRTLATEWMDEEFDAPEIIEDDPEQAFPATVDEIKSALPQLADGLRIVFSLYYLEGYDHEEISGILNISESGSKSQLSKARAKIRSMFTHERQATGTH